MKASLRLTEHLICPLLISQTVLIRYIWHINIHSVRASAIRLQRTEDSHNHSHLEKEAAALWGSESQREYLQLSTVHSLYISDGSLSGESHQCESEIHWLWLLWVIYLQSPAVWWICVREQTESQLSQNLQAENQTETWTRNLNSIKNQNILSNKSSVCSHIHRAHLWIQIVSINQSLQQTKHL